MNNHEDHKLVQHLHHDSHHTYSIFEHNNLNIKNTTFLKHLDHYITDNLYIKKVITLNKSQFNFQDETHQYFKTIKFITQNMSVNHNKYEQLHNYDNYTYIILTRQ